MGDIFNRNYMKVYRKRLRRDSTMPERLLWNELRAGRLGVKFRRQHSIGDYIADFYCPSLKLIIEVDGESHYTEEGKKSDRLRTDYMSELDIEVIRVLNKEVLDNIEGVIAYIIEVLEKRENTCSYHLL